MTRSVKILLMTHGDLGQELIRTASMFLPKSNMLAFMGLHEDDAINEYQKQMEIIIDNATDLLILTDMMSAATTRVAAYALKHGNVEVVSGVNLVMLITALKERDTHDLAELSELVNTTAREDIVNIRKCLKER